MIIDIHTHAFPRKIASNALISMQRCCHTALFSDGTEDGLTACERRAGVGLAVMQPVATNPDKVSHLNDFAIALNERTQGKNLISFGAMHPAYARWEQELERLKLSGAAGIKLHPPYEQIDIDDPKTIGILRKCRELDMIVLIHSGRDVGLPGATQALPAKVRRALDKAGPMKLIAAHMGGWGCWEAVGGLLADTGIYLDTAFSLGRMFPANDGYVWNENDLCLLNAQAFCGLVQQFGADRVLFGTDSPWASPEDEIGKIKALPLPQSEINLILGENAARLLRGVWEARKPTP